MTRRVSPSTSQSHSRSPSVYPRRAPPTGPRAQVSRKPSQPLDKEAGLELLAHCFGFRDATSQAIRNLPKDVVFVAHDFEAYTPAHSGKRPVTEAGVAFFDTRVLDRVSDPGQHGENWVLEILAGHLRVEDRGHLINRHWAHSCGEKFQFGLSQWAPVEEMKNILDRTVRIPDHGSKQAITSQELGQLPEQAPDLRNRNVVLVSHAFHNDDGYMKTPDINFDYDAYGTVVAIVDTQKMGSRPGFEGLRFPALKRLCGNFGIDIKNPHNAGNDAVYTMVSLVLLSLESAHLQGYRQGRGPTNAASAVDELMKRSQENHIRYWLTIPPRPGYRCDVCGRRNSHPADECELHVKCEECGCFGHRAERCKKDWMENAKLGYGNPTSFKTPEDRIKHEFAAMVRQAAQAAKDPIPMVAKGHAAELVDQAFPLLPSGPSSMRSEDENTLVDTASETSSPANLAVKPVDTPQWSPPTGPARDRIAYTKGKLRALNQQMRHNRSAQPEILAGGQCIVTSAPPSKVRYDMPLGMINGNSTIRRGRKKNWTRLELSMAH